MSLEEAMRIAVLGELSSEDEEDCVMFALLRYRNEIRRRSKYGRLNIKSLTDEEVKLNFRFEKEHLESLRVSLGIPNLIRTRERLVVTGLEGLCIVLRRLAYPNRWSDLEPLFGLSGPYMCSVFSVVVNIINRNRKLSEDLSNLNFWNEQKLQTYSEAIAQKGCPIKNCWGFIDGTARAICRPSLNQQEYYSGHKRQHCVKYQSILTPDGMIVSLHGPYPGRRHDAGIFRDSGIYQQLERSCNFEFHKYVLYGDPAYPIKEYLLCPYANTGLDRRQGLFNSTMSRLRQSVEWGFGKIISVFAFLDFKKNQKLLLHDISGMYQTAVILTNCHTCLYGSQTSNYFSSQPPTLEEYISR